MQTGRTHVSDKGKGPCHAKSEETCPMTLNGEKAPHFSNEEEAQKFYESTMEKKNSRGLFVVKKKEKKETEKSQREIVIEKRDEAYDQLEEAKRTHEKNLSEFQSKTDLKYSTIYDLDVARDGGKYLVDARTFSSYGKLLNLKETSAEDIYQPDFSVTTDTGSHFFSRKQNLSIGLTDKPIEETVGKEDLERMRSSVSDLSDAREKFQSAQDEVVHSDSSALTPIPKDIREKLKKDSSKDTQKVAAYRRVRDLAEKNDQKFEDYKKRLDVQEVSESQLNNSLIGKRVIDPEDPGVTPVIQDVRATGQNHEPGSYVVFSTDAGAYRFSVGGKDPEKLYVSDRNVEDEYSGEEINEMRDLAGDLYYARRKLLNY